MAPTGSGPHHESRRRAGRGAGHPRPLPLPYRAMDTADWVSANSGLTSRMWRIRSRAIASARKSSCGGRSSMRGLQRIVNAGELTSIGWW